MKEYRVKRGSQLNLDTCDPDDTGEYKKTEQDKEKAKAITASFFRSHFAEIWRSQWVCFMLNESMQEKLIFAIDTFF